MVIRIGRFRPFTLQQIFQDHPALAGDIVKEIKPLQYRYSWSDYLAWPEGERYELVDGIAYAMSPAPRRRHQEISGEIFRQAANALRKKPCRVYDAPFDVKLSSDESDDAPTVVQPDITVTLRPHQTDGAGDDRPPGSGDRDRLP